MFVQVSENSYFHTFSIVWIIYHKLAILAMHLSTNAFCSVVMFASYFSADMISMFHGETSMKIVGGAVSEIAGSEAHENGTDLLTKKDGVFVSRVVYHGTNQPFVEFSSERLGENTGSLSSAHGFFFADDPECSFEYALAASRKLVSDKASFEQKSAQMKATIDKLERVARSTGNWSAYEEAYDAWESLEIDAMNEPEGIGCCIYPVRLLMSKPLVVDMSQDELGEQRNTINPVTKALSSGCDGVVFLNIADNPGERLIVCTHAMVFKKEQIVPLFSDLSMAMNKFQKTLNAQGSRSPANKGFS